MISYIKGELVEIFEDMIVVENSNIGYNIRVPLSLLEGLPSIGKSVKIFIYFYVREDSMNLYGFFSRYDLEMFKQLLGVNGIGPKGALGILSALSPDDLRMAIITDNPKAIAKAPGIGSKTAQRVILDLKDKIKPEEVFSEVFMGNQRSNLGVVIEVGKEAIEALVALGYSSVEAAKAVRKVDITQDMDIQQVLKAALKHLAFL